MPDIMSDNNQESIIDSPEAIVEVVNVSKSFQNQPVLDSVDMVIPKGKLVAITGTSGCGKSTLIKIMAALLYPDSGKVYIDNVDIFQLSRRKLFDFRKNLGFVFQDAALISNLSIFENIALPLKYHYSASEESIFRQVNNILEEFGLIHLKNYLPAQLSMGQRKLISFVRAIIMKPKLLFLDEPVTGIDAIARQKMTDMILPLRDNPDITVIMVSHNLDFIKKSADYIALVHQNKLLAYGKRDKIIKSRDPIINRILSIIIDEEALIAEEVLGILTGE